MIYSIMIIPNIPLRGLRKSIEPLRGNSIFHQQIIVKWSTELTWDLSGLLRIVLFGVKTKLTEISCNLIESIRRRLQPPSTSRQYHFGKTNISNSPLLYRRFPRAKSSAELVFTSRRKQEQGRSLHQQLAAYLG